MSSITKQVIKNMNLKKSKIAAAVMAVAACLVMSAEDVLTDVETVCRFGNGIIAAVFEIPKL